MAEKTQSKMLPLSKTEYGIYADFVNNAQSTAYNLPLFSTFDKSTDVQRLKKAVEAVFDNHSYLKTRLYVADNGEICKSICDEPAQVEIMEMSDGDFNKYDYIRPFDLLGEPLYRCCIFKLDSSVVLFYDIHHIIFDGYSSQVFMADLDKAYKGEVLEPELYTGNDVSQEEAQRLLTPELDEAKKYYTSVFGGIELESLPLNV